jgi:hypothetical protein
MGESDAMGAIEMELRALRRRRIGGGIFLCDLEDAVNVLFTGVLRGRRLRLAMAEIDMNTRGQGFRIDTPEGPLFGQEALWRFAGRSGIEFKGSTTADPTWPTLRRRAVRLLRAYTKHKAVAA